MTEIKDTYTIIDKIIDKNNIGFDESGHAEMLDRGELLSLMMQAVEQCHIAKDEALTELQRLGQEFDNGY